MSRGDRERHTHTLIDCAMLIRALGGTRERTSVTAIFICTLRLT